jgi:hypothetical protein
MSAKSQTELMLLTLDMASESLCYESSPTSLFRFLDYIKLHDPDGRNIHIPSMLLQPRDLSETALYVLDAIKFIDKDLIHVQVKLGGVPNVHVPREHLRY